MIKYTPASQLSLEGFSHPFENGLDPENRWVKLARAMPWDELAVAYARNLRSDSGRETVDVRMVIGALVVKHKMGLSDRDTVREISENIYIQYFCGMRAFQTARPFDPSLLVDIRKRIGADTFDSFNDRVIEAAEKSRPKRKKARGQDKGNGTGTAKNRGTLKVDATIADQMIKYPTDLALLNDAREQAERIIDQIWKLAPEKAKPRDYRRVARKAYLGLAKKKKKTKRELGKAIKQQLQYLKRDIGIIHRLLDGLGPGPFPLDARDQRLFWVVQLVHDQQLLMYQSGAKSCPNRIVNLFQPWVRPMVRGKDKANVEFGSKINVSEVDGFSKINRISWEAYNEGQDLPRQLEDFRSTFGHYPGLLLADRIYLTRENRALLKDKGIRIVGKPLGRPPKEELSAYERQKQKKERNQRNHIEGKFGQGKNAYALNRIRARRRDTSESWIAAIFFVMNLTKLMQLAEKGFFGALSALRQACHQLDCILTAKKRQGTAYFANEGPHYQLLNFT